MAKIHRVIPGADTDLSWVYTADDDEGQLRTGETIASVDSVNVYDADGNEVEGVFAETPAPSVDGLTVTARCKPAVATFTADATLYEEVLVTTSTGRSGVPWLDRRGERPRLWINARP